MTIQSVSAVRPPLVPWSFMACVLAVFLLASTADAKPPDPVEAQAREFYAQGTAHFEAGRYLEAQGAFAAGYELSHKPGFLWNMAESARLLGNRARAVELYRRYLEEAPDGPQRADVDKRLQALDPKPAPQEQVPAPVASVPPAPVASVPPAPPAALAPRVESGSNTTVGRSSPDVVEAPVHKRWWFWTGAAAVVTVAVVAGVVAASSGTKHVPGRTPSGDQTIDWRMR